MEEASDHGAQQLEGGDCDSIDTELNKTHPGKRHQEEVMEEASDHGAQHLEGEIVTALIQN